MKNIKEHIKNNRGSITTVVVVTVLFFLTILSTAYSITTTIRKSQLKSQLETKQIYEKDLDNVNEILDNSYAE